MVKNIIVNGSAWHVYHAIADNDRQRLFFCTTRQDVLNYGATSPQGWERPHNVIYLYTTGKATANQAPLTQERSDMYKRTINDKSPTRYT
jgi:hypothetical protein